MDSEQERLGSEQEWLISEHERQHSKQLSANE